MDIVYKSKKHVDAAGQRIDFDGPYFDKAARRTFKKVEDKAAYMKANNLVNTGDSFAKYKQEVKAHHEMKMDTDTSYRKKHGG